MQILVSYKRVKLRTD